MLRWLFFAVVLLSPLTMFRVAGMNIQPWTFLFPILLAVVALSDGDLVVAPTSRVLLGEVLFVFAIVLSLTQSPFPHISVLDSTQYLLIFFAVVPLSLMLFDTQRSRWTGTVLLALTFGLVGVLHTALLITGGVPNMGYGNENIPQVMTCAGAILWGGLTMTERVGKRLRQLALGVSLLLTVGVIIGPSNGAKIMLFVAGWGAAWYAVNLRRPELRPHFWTVTAIVSTLGIAVIATNWSKVLTLLNNRVPMYTAAASRGIHLQPLGGGMSSADILLNDLPPGVSREIHNIWLSHWFEFGIIGLFATVLIFLDWLKMLVQAIRGQVIKPWEAAVVVLFGAWFVQVQFQPAPVTRVWWIVYALSFQMILPSTDGSRCKAV